MGNDSRLVIHVDYAKWSRAFNLVDGETHGLVVSKEVIHEEMADWSPSLLISDTTASIDILDT